jgi:Tfp pilus assembly protein PilF
MRIAVEIDPGEQGLYIALADLYKMMKKDPQEIRAVYERGIKTVVGGGNLVISYASYLYDIGDYKESLKYYRALAQAFPANTGYAGMVKELENKLKQ